MKDILYKILWSTIEDDVGLWEINWELNSLFPTNTTTQNREVAKKILVYFLKAGFVNFYFSKWGSDDTKQIDKPEAIEIILGDKFWDAPSLNEPCIKVGNTEKGKEYYNKELIDDIVL